MAVDKKLQIFDDEGNPVDYDILASDVKFLPDGKDLPTKLAEMEEGIGEGGYTPPQGGIPKTDLAPSVQQTLDDVANKVDKVTGKGLSTNDYTDAEKSKLGNLPTADQLTQQLGGKANDSAVIKSISVNGQTQQKDTNGNVNVVVPTVVLDDAPTAGSNNGVKSGGVKTALDNLLANLHIVNGEWYIGSTATGVSAQGPAGNVNITDASQLVTILVNDLTTGGAGNILSAEMGKVLKAAVQTLIDSMGEYCFPNGRPTLSWEGPKCNVTQTLTDVTSNFSPSRVDKNGSLDVTLTPVDNLHVFLTGDVTVEMGGTDITSTAWNESTGKVTIADVTDDVVITAKSSTYVQSGLVLMFDGKNQGETAGQWKDLANTSRSVALTGGYTQNSDNVQLDGTGYGMGSFVDNVTYDQSTAECVFNQSASVGNGQVILLIGKIGSPILAQFNINNTTRWSSHAKGVPDTFTANRSVYVYSGSTGNKYSVSYYGNKMLQNGALLTAMSGQTSNEDNYNVANHQGKTAVGAQITGGGDIIGFKGNLYCVRLYSRVLNDAEVQQNWKVDQKRFNIS